jgi:ABC-type multidrug transport system fused ATPase/permease subunit
VGSIYKILDRGTENQLFFLYTLLLGVLRSVSQIIFISIILFIVDWRMAIATLILIPVAVLIGTFIYKRVAPTQKKLDQTYAEGFAII